MRNATNSPVLVLNASFEAIAICASRRALALVVKDTALVLEHDGREVRAGIMFPTVIRLKEYKKIPHRVQVLTRKNLLARDNHECQYCGEAFSAWDLTLDHVVPRSKGGPATWENLVACCGPCNRRKGNMSCEEAGMPLLRRPRPVSIHTSRGILRAHGETERTWQRYLFYDNEGSKQHMMQG